MVRELGVRGSVKVVKVLTIQFKKKKTFQSSHRGAMETNPTRNNEIAGSILGLTLWVKDQALP